MIGEILDGKYRIDKQLGAGGMGNVYLATHLGTTRLVAVKVIAPRWASDPQFLARFQREAQACGRLRHANIVNVTDFGIAKTDGGDVAYLVMEYLDGETLSDFQKDHPTPPLPLIADLLDQIGLALAEAHRHGIVHRDLKPDNIWLEPNGRGGYSVKVLDFGVAKVNLLGEWAPVSNAAAAEVSVLKSITVAPSTPTDNLETIAIETAPEPRSARSRYATEEVETVAIAATPHGSSQGAIDSGAEAHTMPGSLIGTPAYMSPEQALGKEIDFRSDIYSLAVVAYSLVCNELPFTGKAGELFDFHITGNPPSPASRCNIPADVSDTVLAGLARNPEDRPPSALAFARRFHNAVDAEFLALRRSRAFLMQHLAAYILLIVPIYGTILGITAILAAMSKHVVPAATIRVVLVSFAAAILFIFFDNVLRAAAALMAIDEQTRVRRFLAFRVIWKLVKSIPILLKTQIESMFFWGSNWLTGDSLWPVICVVERKSGRGAIQRSRELMTGLRSAGRALAIRHLALATLAIADVVKSIGFLFQSGKTTQPNVVVTAVWFPIFAIFAAAPLFLYDRTAANEGGPLLQLDRTPEVRVTSRAFSVSSMIWLAAGVIYLLYQPIELLLFGVK